MTAFDAAALADRMECHLTEYGHPDRAVGEKRYLRSVLGHLGVRVPVVRRSVQTVRREHPNLSRGDLFALVDALWRRPVHEMRLAAVELLRAYRPLLRPSDLRYVEELARQCRTWALLDPLAVHVAGSLVVDAPEHAATLDRWADDDFWMRRAALLALLPAIRGDAGDWREPRGTRTR